MEKFSLSSVRPFSEVTADEIQRANRIVLVEAWSGRQYEMWSASSGETEPTLRISCDETTTQTEQLRTMIRDTKGDKSRLYARL